MSEPMNLAELMIVYQGSNGDLTKSLYERLIALGPKGVIACNLFRALKNSERAKVYRGGKRGQGSYRSMAYERKQWAMDNLCNALEGHARTIGLVWGWGYDAKAIAFEHVLYVETPFGQVSFHTSARGTGPDYPGQWDGVEKMGSTRICRWIEHVLAEEKRAG